MRGKRDVKSAKEPQRKMTAKRIENYEAEESRAAHCTTRSRARAGSLNSRSLACTWFRLSGMHARVSVHPCVCVGRARVRGRVAALAPVVREEEGREKRRKEGKKKRARGREKKRRKRSATRRRWTSERASAKARKRTTGYKDPLLAYIKAT